VARAAVLSKVEAEGALLDLELRRTFPPHKQTHLPAQASAFGGRASVNANQQVGNNNSGC